MDFNTDLCWQIWRVQLADWVREWDYTAVQRLHHRTTQSHGTEGWKGASEDNKWMILQCATFSKSLNPRNIDKSVSDIRIRIRFPFENSFCLSVSGCKLTILPDIQPAKRIVIISVALHSALQWPNNRDFRPQVKTFGQPWYIATLLKVLSPAAFL